MNVIQRLTTMLEKHKRVGGPRQQWLLYTSRYAWEKIERGMFENIEEQNHKLLELARSRQFWVSLSHARGFTHVPRVWHGTMAVKKNIVPAFNCIYIWACCMHTHTHAIHYVSMHEQSWTDTVAATAQMHLQSITWLGPHVLFHTSMNDIARLCTAVFDTICVHLIFRTPKYISCKHRAKTAPAIVTLYNRLK